MSVYLHGTRGELVGELRAPFFVTERQDVARRYAEGAVFGAGRGTGAPAVYEVRLRGPLRVFDARTDRATYDMVRKLVRDSESDPDDWTPPHRSAVGPYGLHFGYLHPAMPHLMAAGFDAAVVDEGSQGESLALFYPQRDVLELSRLRYVPNAAISRLRYVGEHYSPVVAYHTLVVALPSLGIDDPNVLESKDFWRELERVEPFLPKERTLVERNFVWVANQFQRLAREYPENPLEAWWDTTYVLRSKLTAITLWARANHVDLNRVTLDEALDAIVDFAAGEVRSQGEIIYTFDDGWTVQRLSPEHLEEEGEVMQNCLGTFCSQLGPAHWVLSLRDPRGQPHVSMEVEAGRFVQIVGKQNASPEERYAVKVRRFLWEYQPDPLGLLLAGEDPELIDLRAADLTDVDLSAIDLSGLDLSYADFGFSSLGDLEGSNLSDARLSGATGHGTDFTKANLRGADLSNVEFYRASFVSANLQAAILRDGVFEGADFSEANMQEVSAEGAVFDGSVFDTTNFRNANLRSTSFERVKITMSEFAGATLERSTLAGRRKR